MSVATILNKVNPILKKPNYIISVLILLTFFFVLMTHLSQEVRDLDIWLHLKTGEQIVLNNKVDLTDRYSFTKPGSQWINHEWMFQIIAFLCFNKFGFDGLILLQNLVFALIFLLMFLLGFRNRNFLFLSSMLYILLLNASYRFTIRPDMFSVLFLVLFLFILLEKNKYLYLLPILQIFWANFHGFFFLGPILILIFAITKKDLKLWVMLILVILANLVNPQFINGALYPFKTGVGLIKDRFIFQFVQELRPPLSLHAIFNLRDWTFLKALIIISAFSFRFNQKRFNPSLLLLWLISLMLSFLAVRNIVYFSFISVIAIFYNVRQRLATDQSLSNKRLTDKNYYYIGRYFLICILGLSMVKNANHLINTRYFDFDNYNFKSGLWGESLRNFPSSAIDFIVTNNLPERMFNDFNSGSYFIGKAFPKKRVFIDGRTEFYGNEFLKQYKKICEGDKEAVEGAIEKYNLEGFILTNTISNFDDKLAKLLIENKDFKLIYFNEDALIFLRNTPENKNLIRKFTINIKNWRAQDLPLNKIGARMVFPYKNIKRANVLEKLGYWEASISEASQALKLIPGSAKLYETIGNCYFELKKYQLAFENYRTAISLAPGSTDWKIRYAECLLKLNYLDDAKNELEEMYKKFPKNKEIIYNLALTYKQQGMLPLAEKTIQSIVCDTKEVKYQILLAEIFKEEKKFSESLNSYKIALKLDSKNKDIKKSIENIEKTLVKK